MPATGMKALPLTEYNGSEFRGDAKESSSLYLIN